MSCCQYKTLLNCIINARFSQLTHLTPFLKYSLDFIRAKENEKNTSESQSPGSIVLSSLPPERDYECFVPNPSHTSSCTLLSMRCPSKVVGFRIGWFSQLRRLEGTSILHLFFNQRRIPITVVSHQKRKISVCTPATEEKNLIVDNCIVHNRLPPWNHLIWGRIHCQNSPLFSPPLLSNKAIWLIWWYLFSVIFRIKVVYLKTLSSKSD